MKRDQLNIKIIGAGGIVKDAHLPAYTLAGWTVDGIFDLNQEKAEALARNFNIEFVHDSLRSLIEASNEHTIFDVAVPGASVLSVLKQLPDHSVVLIQKPMGEDLTMAKEILQVCRSKKLEAGMNFQLRYAPFIRKARSFIEEGFIGTLCDIEINVNVFTPWHLWDFLFDLPRMEILYHSIHYIDLIRSFFGNPENVYAKTTKHPNSPNLSSVRSNIIMDYGEMTRASILTNHNHDYGEKHQSSYIKLEGTEGAVRIRMGVLKSYPQGENDLFEIVQTRSNVDQGWQTVDIEGTWFPHAFIGTMQEMIKAKYELNYKPNNSVEDAIYTMICVEAAYESSHRGGVSLNQFY